MDMRELGYSPEQMKVLHEAIQNQQEATHFSGFVGTLRLIREDVKPEKGGAPVTG